MTIKFKDTKIHLSFFFALSLALLGIFDKSGSVLLCILSGILHEAGHLFVLLISGEKPQKICITPFGMRIERIETYSLGFIREAVCAFSGPLVNLILFAIFHKNHFGKINLTIALLNLLPAEPLDGGKILENLLKIKLNFEKAEKISLVISCITVFPVAIIGFIILFQSRYNFSLLLISFYMIFFIAMKKRTAFADD